MTVTRAKEFTFCFSYSHYGTDGKYQNMADFLEAANSQSVCLNMLNPTFDPPILPLEEVRDRLDRIRRVVGKLNKQGFTVELILPGLSQTADQPVNNSYWRDLYHGAAKTRVKRIWINDTVGKNPDPLTRQSLLKWSRLICEIIRSSEKKVILALLADETQRYIDRKMTFVELTEALANKHRPVFAQSQGFFSDVDRTAILTAAQGLSTAAVMTPASVQRIGYIKNRPTGGFHKSSEAMQMQINLNILHGIDQILIDCFDDAGTAPGTDHLYLQMIQKNEAFMRKLAKLLPNCDTPDGVRVLADSDSAHNNWPGILWRLGIPACVHNTETLLNDNDEQAVLVTGKAALSLKPKAIKAILHQGSLWDAESAGSLEPNQLEKWLGVKASGRIRNINAEIFSDQSFACPYYGYRTPWRDTSTTNHFYRFTPCAEGARTVSHLLLDKGIPNHPGMVLFDDVSHNRRSALLPFGGPINAVGDQPSVLLCKERQRHLYEILCWLKRNRLNCFIENTPDLVPFYIPVKGKSRIVLALLNIGFDWAIHTRIRLGKTHFKVKRIRSLEEDGRICSSKQLQVTRHRDYEFIQLTSEASVPPMQMTVLVLEG